MKKSINLETLFALTDIYEKNQHIIKDTPMMEEIYENKVRFKTEFICGTKITSEDKVVQKAAEMQLSRLRQWLDTYNQI